MGVCEYDISLLLQSVQDVRITPIRWHGTSRNRTGAANGTTRRIMDSESMHWNNRIRRI